MSIGLGVTTSVSKSVSTTVVYDLKKNEDSKGYYVYETFTKGYASYIQFVKIKCNTGTTVKNIKNTIAYSPRRNYKPTEQYNYFKNDPQTSGRYEHIYS